MNVALRALRQASDRDRKRTRQSRKQARVVVTNRGLKVVTVALRNREA